MHFNKICSSCILQTCVRSFSNQYLLLGKKIVLKTFHMPMLLLRPLSHVHFFKFPKQLPKVQISVTISSYLTLFGVISWNKPMLSYTEWYVRIKQKRLGPCFSQFTCLCTLTSLWSSKVLGKLCWITSGKLRAFWKELLPQQSMGKFKVFVQFICWVIP